ncbi:MAG: enoyl-CoA hydratase-related protein [Jatrophihabitans sp.]
MDDVVLLERESAVATITLNRPESMNSMSVALKEALIAAVAEVSDDPDVRAVVLTGGPKAFCVGQDLKEHVALLAADDPAPLNTVEKHFNPLVLALAAMPKPVVAAVNGMAAGAGASLTFACDFRIADAKAKFLLAFAGIGLTLDSGASWTLPRLIGSGRALAMAMLAEPINAEQALQMGMISGITPEGQALTEAHALATRLAAGPTHAYAAIKRSLHEAATLSLADALALEGELQRDCGQTEDHRTAVASFVAKQKPTFTGH